jgi:hypothetical protein
MKSPKISILALLFVLATVTASFAQLSASAGADLVSRYLWRGWDFGNSAAVQPALAVSTPAGEGSFEIGAWGSFGVAGGIGTSDAFNENDLYASFSYEQFSFVLTDYFFPGYSGDDGFFKFGDDGAHILELGAAVEQDIFSASAYYAFSAPEGTEKSFYVELGVTPPLELEDVGMSLFIGGGNGFYDFVDTGEDTKFVVTNIGVTVSRGMFASTWAVNPDQKTSFLVFMVSL